MSEAERAWVAAFAVVVVVALIGWFVVAQWSALRDSDDGVVRHNWTTDRDDLSETEERLETLDLASEDLGPEARVVTDGVLGCAAAGEAVAQPERLVIWDAPEEQAEAALAGYRDQLEGDRWDVTSVHRGETVLERDFGSWASVATLTTERFIDDDGAARRSVVVSAVVEGAQPCEPD